MNKKKLIGTIIGVAMFAALIAGATYAFLSFTANAVNFAFNGTTMNFLVDYTNGNAITGLPQVKGSIGSPGTTFSTSDLVDVTPNNVSKLVVIATKHNNSVDGHLQIRFTTQSANTVNLVKDGNLINWIICRDPDVESGGRDSQVDDVCGTSFTGATNWGKISATGEIIMLNDAALANSKVGQNTQSTETSNKSTHLIESDGVSYFIYFWIDSRNIHNRHINEQFKGYVHATATQIVE